MSKVVLYVNGKFVRVDDLLNSFSLSKMWHKGSYWTCELVVSNLILAWRNLTSDLRYEKSKKEIYLRLSTNWMSLPNQFSWQGSNEIFSIISYSLFYLLFMCMVRNDRGWWRRWTTKKKFCLVDDKNKRENIGQKKSERVIVAYFPLRLNSNCMKDGRRERKRGTNICNWNDYLTFS